MKWVAFINRRGGKSSKHEFELPNTTRADMAYACLEASKKFRAPESAVLCIPAPKGAS